MLQRRLGTAKKHSIQAVAFSAMELSSWELKMATCDMRMKVAVPVLCQPSTPMPTLTPMQCFMVPIMSRFFLMSSCDDAGNVLASRIDRPGFMRVIEIFDSLESAELGMEMLLASYATRGIAIGSGCLKIEVAE